MLKKRNRLTTKEFQEVFQGGKKVFSKNFLLIFKQEKEGQKVSVTVSKKIAKKAFQRVFFRRKVYKILRENFEIIPKNFWAVLVIHKDIKDLKKSELEKEIKILFKKLDS